MRTTHRIWVKTVDGVQYGVVVNALIIAVLEVTFGVSVPTVG